MSHYYKKVFKPALGLPVPVISIGNISLGGTGKTPFAMYLYKLLKENGYNKIAIITRGYKRKGRKIRIVGNDNICSIDNIGDEPFLISQNLSDCLLLVGDNKRELLRKAFQDYGVDALILDDAFRHIDINSIRLVTVDGKRGFGNCRLLPAGPLRQPYFTLEHADFFIITKTDINIKIEKSLKEFSKPVFYSYYRTLGIFDRNSIISTIDKKRAVLISGIGNNDSFRETCESLGLMIKGFIQFLDHRNYDEADVEFILSQYKARSFDFYLTTEKDYYKLIRFENYFENKLYYVKIEMDFRSSDFDYEFINEVKKRWKK